MYVIKEFEEKYNKEINDFVISIFVDEYGFEEHRGEIQQENNGKYKESEGNFWIAVDDEDQIVGTIGLYKMDDNTAELKRLYVRKDYRGCGLSKALYEKLIQFCKEKGFRKIFLGTYDKLNTAINFYQKKGFKEIEEANNNDGVKYLELDIA